MKQILVTLLVIPVLFSCGGGKDKDENKKGADTVVLVKPAEEETVNKAPIINIVDTVSPKRIVIYMKDSAATAEGLSKKLAQIFGIRLAEELKKNKISIAGKPMAWFRSQKAPFFFEAGIPVNKRPGKTGKAVFVREMPVDSVVVAHFYGPYSLTPQAYTAVSEWMKETKKKAKSPAYEIYVTDPLDKDGKPVDPYKVRTDIFFPRK